MAQKSSVNKTDEIIGLIYLLIAALLGVAYYVPGVNSGPLGRVLLDLGKGLLGPVAYSFPVLFLILAISSFLRNIVRKHKIRINHVFLLLILLATFIHALTVKAELVSALSFDNENQQTVFAALAVLWKGSQNPALYPSLAETLPGGVMGGLIALGLQRVAGYFGALAIIVTAVLAEAVVIGNFSIERILQGIGGLFGLLFRSIGGIIETASAAIYELTSARAEEEEAYSNEAMHKASSTAAAPKRKPRRKAVEPADLPHEAASARDFVMPAAVGGVPHSKPQPEQPRHYTIDTYKAPDFLLSDAEPKAAPVFDIPDRRTDFLLKSDEEEALKTASDVAGLPAADTIEKVRPVKERPVLAENAASNTEEAPEEAEIEPILIEPEEEKPYEFPPLTLLEPRPVINSTSNARRIHDMAAKLEATLASFGVDAKVVHITTGPSITRFELKPGPGVKISKIVGLGDDIALSLAAVSVRIEAPIPGKSAIGIEIPNTETAIVGLRSMLEFEDYKIRKEKLLVPLGRDIPGQPIFCDLSKMPHLMIAGATGSGKSICINTILISLLYRCSPKEMRLILIDPKVVELSVYGGIPHLLAPVVTDPKKAANTLNWAVAEMTRRYQLFAERHVRDMRGYNEEAELGGYEKLSFIVLVIDELSDLMATSANEVEDAISRLTAMARAAGIHLIIATQRPSVDVITGVIKANIPSRIAFAVSSQVDSRTILDGGGAEKLLGKGDMLYSPQSASKPTRGQGAFVSDHEVENVISFLKAQNLKSYDKKVAEEIVSTLAPGVDTGGSSAEPDEDELLNEAVEVILDAGYASVSVLQRRLNIGYPRAGRLIDAMEMKGYIGPFEGSKPRKVILSRTEWALHKAQAHVEENRDDSQDN